MLNVGLIIDLVLIIIIISIFLLNYFKGITAFLKPFRIFLAFTLAWSYKASDTVKAVIGRFIDFDTFKARLIERIENVWGEKIVEASNGEVANELERFDGIFGIFGDLFGNLKEYCIEQFRNGTEDLLKDVTEFASEYAIKLTINVIGFVSLLIIFSIAFKIIHVIIDAIFKRGILGSINRILGGVVGIFFGLIIAWLASLVIVSVAPMIAPEDPEAIFGGIGLLKWFYNDFILSLL